MMNGMGWGGMWFGSFFGLVVIGLLIWAVISFANSNRSRNDATPQQQSPLDILKKRYASGEITKEEFERMKKELL